MTTGKSSRNSGVCICGLQKDPRESKHAFLLSNNAKCWAQMQKTTFDANEFCEEGERGEDGGCLEIGWAD